MDERIEERMREARREIDAIVERLRVRTETMAAQAERSAARLVPTGQSGGARAEARAAIDNIGDRLRRSMESAAPDTKAAAAEPPAILRRAGRWRPCARRCAEARRNRSGAARPRCGGGRPRQAAACAPQRPARRGRSRCGSAPAPVRVNVELQPREWHRSSELNVIGCNVDEAIARPRSFWTMRSLGSMRTVRVIHGYGTGQLRRAHRRLFCRHIRSVASFAAAPAEQGGGGVTVVELKE